MTAQNRARLLGVAVLVAMFAVGGLTGAVVQRNALAAAREESRRPVRGPSLFETLQLTAEQQREVCLIVARRAEQIRPHNEAMKAVWEERAPAIRAVITEANAEMDSVLTPEQRATKDAFRAEREKYYRERRQKEREQGESRDHRDSDRGRSPGGMGNPLGVTCSSPDTGEEHGQRSSAYRNSPWG